MHIISIVHARPKILYKSPSRGAELQAIAMLFSLPAVLCFTGKWVAVELDEAVLSTRAGSTYCLCLLLWPGHAHAIVKFNSE